MNSNDTLSHLEYFKTNALVIDEYELLLGKKPATFSYLSENILPENKLSRTELFDMAAKKSLPIDVICISILAWGGVHKKNIDDAFSCKDVWLPIAENIRNGKLNRTQAYEAFYSLRQDHRLKGMGAAYYTKLIYFLMPKTDEPHGYIMDQWVACGVNLLAGRNVVLLDTSYRWTAPDNRLSTYIVSDANTAEHYEEYCNFIEGLADQVGISPDETEYCLMSEGGRVKQPWRNYVIKNRRIFE